MTDLDSRDMREPLLELLTYLAASANGAIASSKLYGPLRLMEACERLIQIMERLGVADPELRGLAEQIVAQGMLLSTDADFCQAFTDQATLMFARKLKETTIESS